MFVQEGFNALVRQVVPVGRRTTECGPERAMFVVVLPATALLVVDGGSDMYPMRGVDGKPLLLHAEPKLATGSRETSDVDDVGNGHDFAVGAGETSGCEAEFLKFDLDFIEGR